MHKTSPWFPWESATHQPQVSFDLRAEREEYERLFTRPARVLQDRMVRRSRTDRTRTPRVPETQGQGWRSIAIALINRESK